MNEGFGWGWGGTAVWASVWMWVCTCMHTWVPAHACVCLHPRVCIREGLPAGSVVVGEGEVPPDGQLWQERPALIKGPRKRGREGGGGESSRQPGETRGEAAAAEWGIQGEGVLQPTVGPLNKEEQTPAYLLPRHWLWLTCWNSKSLAL